MVGVKSNGNLIGVIGLADPIREEAATVLNQLREVGVSRTFLVTGDRLESAQLVADQVGITDIFASISAEGKLNLVEQAMKDHKGSVLFVGDGINDAPALSAATVGIAMGARGASAASESADVVIVEDSIAKLVHVIAIAKFSHKRAVQAALLGMGLSLVAMALASLGLMTSTVGAATQEVIDIVAILWALTALGKSDYSAKITA
jgi:P-type E1-E2 ATPase